MDISNKSIAILVDQQYQEMEVWYPKFRFWEEGAEVSLIGPEKAGVYLSKVGYPAEADEAASEVKGSDFDALVIPGGFAPDFMRRNDDMIRLVREVAARAGTIAVIEKCPEELKATLDVWDGRPSGTRNATMPT